jgi:hypothetical protein
VKTRLTTILLSVLSLSFVIGNLPAGEILAAEKRADPFDGRPPAAQSVPRVSVAKEEHDFGKIDVGATGRYEFVFTNSGNSPLKLAQGRSTCGCCTCICEVQLPENAIAPGESCKVTLEWKSKLYVGPFRQTATILTNDPDRHEVLLLVKGRFAGPVGVVPSELHLTRVSLERSTTATVRMYNYMKEPLEIVGHEFSDPKIGEYFDVSLEPLSPERLRENTEARGGYLVRISVNSGLRPGSFRQRIVFKTKSKSVPTVELPVYGMVTGDIVIAGRGWDSHTGVVTMGTVNSSRGTVWPLVVVARGPHAKDVKLETVNVVPGALEIALAPTVHMSQRELAQTRLTISIPPGTQPATHLGLGQGDLGRITLRTNLPRQPELEIKVRFAVKK